VAVVGISKHAEEELGDIALVQLPEVGRIVRQAEKFGEIESIKAVSELYAPVSGEVTEVNDTLETAPQTVNSDPLGAGWLVRVRIADPSELESLLDQEAYDKLIEE
jgi:glycine cleavage system H protein